MDLPVGEHLREVPLATGCGATAAETPNDNNRPLPHLSIEQQRLQSGRNRLGTPRHEQRAANCDTQNQISIRQQNVRDSSASVASTASTMTNETNTSNQAPPSYGTATRSCATLDAGQLHQIQMERQRQLILARVQQQHHQQELARSSWQDRVNLEAAVSGAAIEHINQTAGQQHHRLSNFESCPGGFRVGPPVSCTHSLGNLAAILRQQQQQQQQQHHQRPIDDSYGFLSRARGWQQQQQQRLSVDKDQRPLQIAADTLACASSQVSQQQQQPRRAGKQEEGIYATLNVMVPAAARLPINHVISGRASMQLERQQQQHQQQHQHQHLGQRAQELQWRAQAPLHNCAHNHNHQPQLQSQHEQTNQLAAGTHLANPRCPPTLARFDCATATGPEPTSTTDRLVDISSSSASSCCGLPATTNHANVEQTLRHCAPPNSFPAAIGANGCLGSGGGGATSEQNSSTLTCQNNDFASRAGPLGVMASSSSSKDDAGDAHDGAKCDKNRKRRSRQRLDEIPGGAGDSATYAPVPPDVQGELEAAAAATTTTINYGAKSAVHASEQTSATSHQNNSNNQTASAGVSSQQPQQTGPATISAHCWLIDSGDESRNGIAGVAPPKSPSNCDAEHSAHLRPRARSIDRLERTVVRRLAPASNKLCHTLKPSGSRPVHHHHQNQTTCVATSVSSPNVNYDRSDDDQDEATTDCDERQRRPPQRRHRRRTRTSRTPSSRRPTAGGRRSSASSPYENASTVVRLSAVLNFVSNLVSGRSRSRQRPTSKSAASSKERYASAATTSSYSNRTLPGQSYTNTGASSMAYSSSTSAYVTGNSSLNSHDCHSSSIQHVPLAPSLASHSSPRNRTPTSSPFVALSCTSSFANASQPQTGGIPQQLYTVSIPSTAVSHHSYEYCDDLPPTSSITARTKKVYDCSEPIKQASNHIPVEHLELTTMDNREQPWTPGRRPTAAAKKDGGSSDSHAVSCSETASSGSASSPDRATRSPAQMVGLTQTGLTHSGRPLAQTLMSDNELISSAASCSHHQSHYRPPRLPPASRRRWWWNSFKLWLTRRSSYETRAKLGGIGGPALSTDDDDGSLTHQRPAGLPNSLSGGGGGDHAATGSGGAAAREPAARYRCLKPAGVPPSGSFQSNYVERGKPSTLQNVISLAKVDRVFRCRLLASLAISLVLLLLICLLAFTIYKRSSVRNPNHLSNGRLSLNTMHSSHYANKPLYMDDADFDLSWLWPAPQQPQQMRGPPGEHEQPSSLPPPLLNLDGRDLDGQLSSLLHVIDRSERIQQFQLAVTHLTNLQLANDHFIDLTQLGEVLHASSKPSSDAQIENRTASHNESSYETTNNTFVSQLELDLASLTLLSNLYWPLVKWRHQSQRSLAANFLSFALSTATGNARAGSAGQPGENDAGASAIRNLLNSLILVESFSPDNLGQQQQHSATLTYVNLQQFQRLNQNLRLASYHLLVCSGADSLELSGESSHPSSAPETIRAEFCQLLTRRYKRMMLALGELEHGELAELHRREQLSLELPASVYGSQDRTSHTRDKNILGFLLDRLALLDVRLLAELALSSQQSNALDLDYHRDTKGGQQEPEASSPQLEIELLVTNGQQIDPISGALQRQLQSRWGENVGFGQLYDLVKSKVGDNSVNLMAVGGESKSEELQGGEPVASYQELQLDSYLRHFDQLRAEQADRWYEDLLVADLINPWPARVLPSFVDALNYDLFLHPNLTSRLILGMNKIEFGLARPTRFLVLNCAHLNVIELSLWMKRPPVSSLSPSPPLPPPPPLPPAPDGSDRLGDTGSQAETANQKQDKRQIAIRRVLNLPGSEMLFIELQETIEPYSSLLAAKQTVEAHQRRADFATSSLANGVEFGELPAQSDQFHATPTSSHQTPSAGGAPYRSRSAFIRNQFVLNISFNKTNLLGNRETGDSQGVEFVRYADYYSAPSSHQNQPSQALVADDATATRNMMFTKLVDGEPQTQGQARHLFPCWDEPSYGAKFQLNLVHDYNSQVLFTGQKRERLPYNSQGSLQMTVFERTPVPLSPSLLALVVSDDLHVAKSLTSRLQPADVKQQHEQQQQHIQVQIWAQFEHLAQTEFASQQLVPQLLAFYQAHLEFAYPLDKIDLVAVPRDSHHLPAQHIEQESSQGLGLLRFSQPERLLVDVNLASQDQIEQVAAGISHQLAHQFFGNIISDGQNGNARWLFEALSEYLGRAALAQVQLEWHLDEQFQLSSVHETLVGEQLGDLIASSAPTVLWARQFDSALTGGATGAAESTAPSLELNLMDAAKVNGALSAGRSSSGQSKHSALVHMMLATLLPTQEARARLLRLCLQAHQYDTMSVHQFWRNLNRLLKTEPAAHDGRLDLAAMQRVSRDDDGDDQAGEANQDLATSDHLVHVYTEAPTSTSEPTAGSATMNGANSTSSERVVFVSHRKRNRKQSQEDHRPQRVSRPRADLWLKEAADQWLELASFPLITASCYRDHLQLRQAAFRPLACKWLSATGAPTTSTDGETAARNKRAPVQTGECQISNEELQPPVVWPIPLLFVSRLNPRASRFVWLAEREAEVSLLGTIGSSSGTNNSSVVVEYGATTSSSGAANRLPQQYSWFKLNHNGSSLVRVNYDERNWEALTSLLARAHYSNHQLNPLDRANLLDDAMTLMRHGQLSVSLAMNLTLYLELGERDYQPWSTILGHFDRLQTLLNQNPLWHQYVLKLVQPISIVVGWKDDGPHLMRKLRRELFALAIAYGDEKILAKARHEFRAWMLRSNAFLVPNLQELVYVAGVKFGDQAEWFHCWQKYQQLAGGAQLVSVKSTVGNGRAQVNATTTQAQLLQVAAAARNRHLASGSNGAGSAGKRPGNQLELEEDPTGVGGATSLLENEKRQLLTALASTQNTWLLEQFLNYSLDSTKIQPHHLGHVLATLGKNPVARLYLWRFVRLNWFHLEERFLPAEPAALESMILESTRHFATELDYEEVSSFFESKWSNSATWSKWPAQVKRAIQASLAAIRANIRWRDSIEPKLTRWLSHYNNIAA